jgi:flagellar hook protein FlgE
MGSALWAGISGLNASAKELDVIANNLANVNTIGFKSGTTYFSDILSQSISGGSSGNMQVGRGVAVSEVQTQFGSGSFETTGNATDAAIDGDGFFQVKDTAGATFYTRAGAFIMDANGVLIDTNGYTLQGMAVTNGKAVGSLGDINLQGVQSSPVKTTMFSLGANLNSQMAAGDEYNATQTIYDSQGASHTLNTTFTKTGNTALGYWAINSTLDGKAGTMEGANGLIFRADGTILPKTGMYKSEIGAVTATEPAPAATVAVLGTGAALATQDDIVLTRGATADAADWVVTTAANYPHMVVKSVDGNVVTIDADTTDANTAGDITLTLSGVWEKGDTAAFSITTPYAAGPPVVTPVLGVGAVVGAVTATDIDPAAVAAITVHTNLTKDDSIVLTHNGTGSTIADWTVTTNANYPDMKITAASATSITIASDGTNNDITLDLTNGGAAPVPVWEKGDTAAFTITGDPLGAAASVSVVTAASALTATATLNRPGMVYQTGTMTLTRGVGGWGFANDADKGGYNNAIVTSTDINGPVTINLDGNSTPDVTLDLGAEAWATGDTAKFTLTCTNNLPISDVFVDYSGVTLDGGATIGNDLSQIKWSMTGSNQMDITQFASPSVIRSLSADGYASGQIKSLSIAGNGRISGYFTNGQTTELSQIILARFADPWGLKKMGNNLFGETVASGKPKSNEPGNAGMGFLSPNAVEMSNTDIATEFIKMITAQKAYQASARVITTEDTLMQELMNLKR